MFRIITFICFLQSTFAFGQYGYKFLSLKEGLPQSDVCAIEEDSLGYLWVGMNAGGLARFDGKTFKRFGTYSGLSCPEVINLTIDASGKLWVATMRTISSYDGEKFVDHLIFNESQGKEIMFRADTFFFRHFRERSWHFLVQNKTGLLNDNHPLNGVFQVMRSRKGMFVGLNQLNGKVIIADQSGYQQVTSEGKFENIFKTCQAKDETILSTDKGIFRIRNNKIEKISSGLEDVLVYDSLENVFWLGTRNSLYYTKDLTQSGVLVTEVSETGINHTFKDSEGNIWFCTRGRGLVKVFRTSFQRIGQNDSKKPNEIVRSIHLTSNGDIWLGTIGSGVRVYQKGKMIHEFSETGLNHIGAIVEDQGGKIWVGSNKGLFSFYKNKWERIYKEIPNVYTMDIDNNNRLLIATRNGELFWIENGLAKQAGRMNSHVRHVAYDKIQDRFMIAFNDGVRFFSNGKLHPDNFINLSANSVAAREDSSIIIGTAGYGLHIVHQKKTKRITTDDGLVDDYIYFVIPDKNYIWLGTNRGIDHIELDENYNLKSIDHFSDYSGLHELECDLNAYFKNDSLLYVGLISGAYQYIKGSNGKRVTHPLHFTKIKFIDGDQNSVSDQINNSINGKFNHLAFAVNTVSQAKGNDIYYSADLSGPVWIKTIKNNNGEFDYAHLPPGKYQLKVTSIDLSNFNYKDQIIYSFTIVPLFYQTWWFKAVVALLVLTSLFGVIRLQQRAKYRKLVALDRFRNQEEQKLRKEISKDFHDELGNELARMSNYLVLLKIKNEVKSDIYETLFGNTQKILVGTKDFIWTLDPANNDISNIVIHLKDFGERLFNEKKIDFSFIGIIPEGIKVPTGYSRQITLIFKEAMTNAFRHSGASEISFGITKELNKITLFIKDNGKGIPPDLDNPTGGLVNMRSRAKKIEAELYLKSENTETFIALTFKV